MVPEVTNPGAYPLRRESGRFFAWTFARTPNLEIRKKLFFWGWSTLRVVCASYYSQTMASLSGSSTKSEISTSRLHA